jgi:hypothetical protein
MKYTYCIPKIIQIEITKRIIRYLLIKPIQNVSPLSFSNFTDLEKGKC